MARGSVARTHSFLKRSLSGVIIGETGDSRRDLGLDGSAENTIGSVNLGVILKRPSRLEIRVDPWRFPDLLWLYFVAVQGLSFKPTRGGLDGSLP